MDPIDFAIYRFLSPGGQARFWAGRRVIDPRITAREIAPRVGISESGVRTRLRRLAERGFLRDRIVVPHPELFGRQVYVAELLVREPGEVERMLADLRLVDGVIFVRDVIDEQERELLVHFLSEGTTGADRQALLLGRLCPAGGRVTARPYRLPPCDRKLSPLDWKVLRCLWVTPEASLAELAKSVGITLKTAARAYHLLADAHACWWTHGPASEEFPLALVGAQLRSPEDREAIVRWVQREAPAWMPVAQDGLGLPPEEGEEVVAGLVPADAPTVLERFVRRLAAEEGIARVRRTFPLGSAWFPEWFADRFPRSSVPAR